MVSIVWMVILWAFSVQGQEQATFSNPIRIRSEHSESVVRVGNYYYVAGLVRRSVLPGIRPIKEIMVQQSPNLTDWDSTLPSTTVYSIPSTVLQYIDYCTIQEIDGVVQITFLLHGDFIPNTVLVIKPDDPNNPLGSWGNATRLIPNEETPSSFHYTVMKHNHKLYLIGSVGLDEKTTGLVIRPMNSPSEASGNQTIFHIPKEEWECDEYEYCSSSRPAVIHNNNVSYVVFTAADVRTQSSLTYVSIREGDDPLVAENWRAPLGPVFQAVEGFYPRSVRDATFTISPDGTETWMFYSARTIDNWPYTMIIQGIEHITWNNITGEPEFPEALHYYEPMPVPSGQGEVKL